MAKHPLAKLRELDPDFLAHFEDMRLSALGEAGDIPQKYRTLIALAVDATEKAEAGVRSLAQTALAQGATAQEIAETLRIVGYIAGVGPLYTAARALEDLI